MPGFPTKNTVIVIAGPTAVGKTSIAISLAQYFNTEIISADSRQCYRELNIGVARPSREELESIPHHFIADHSIEEEITAAGFEEFALRKVDELFRTHDVVIMVGGTGLYIKAFCEGLDAVPVVDSEIRNSIISDYNKKGLEWLQHEVKRADPLFYEKGEIKNPQRLMRALEVITSTGKSILEMHTGSKKQRDFDIVKIGLDLPKEELQLRINQRVDEMMKQGLLEEAEYLENKKHLNALQTVGYKELFDYFNNTISLDQAVELIKIHTRQYAKRQLTWFRRDSSIHWFVQPTIQELVTFLNSL